MRTLFAIVALHLLATSGASAQAAGGNALQTYLTSRAAVLGVAGRDQDPDPRTVFAEVVDAQLSRRDASIWIIDSFEPHVRRISADGSALRAFARKGEGPGEVRDPFSLAVDERHVAILHSGGLSVFTHDGVALAERVSLPFMPEAITAGCRGEWIIYGTAPVKDGRRGRLFGVRIDAKKQAVVRLMRSDTVVSRQWHMGTSRSLSSSGDYMALYYDAARPTPELIIGSCSANRMNTLGTMVRSNVKTEEKTSSDGNHRRATLTVKKDSRWFTGVVPVGEALLMTQMGMDATTFTLVEKNGTRRSMDVAGGFSARDAHNGRLALDVTSDTPQVIVVSADSVAAILRSKGR